MSSKKLYMKDNNKTAHWFGHAKLKTLDTYDIFKRKPVDDDVQASSTGIFRNIFFIAKYIYITEF